jgi:hypothetical protein
VNEDDIDPDRIIRTLNEHEVRYVVIGGLAGNLRGTPIVTHDVDVCYARDKANLERLAGSLAQLGARLRLADKHEIPPTFPLDGRALSLGDSFTLMTDAGPLDILATPTGTKGFEDLDAGASSMEVAPGLSVRVASLDDLLRMKRASARSKDMLHIAELEALRDEIEAFRGAGEDPQQGT